MLANMGTKKRTRGPLLQRQGLKSTLQRALKIGTR